MRLSKKKIVASNLILIFSCILIFNAINLYSNNHAFYNGNYPNSHIFDGSDTVSYTKTIEDEMTEIISSESEPLYMYQKFSIEESQYLNNVSIFIQDIIDEYNYTDRNSWEVAILNCSNDEHGTPEAILGSLKKPHPLSVAAHWEVFDFQNSESGSIFLNISRTCQTQTSGIDKYWFAFRVKIPPDDTGVGGGPKILYFNPDGEGTGEGDTFKFYNTACFEDFTYNNVNEILDPLYGTQVLGNSTSLTELDEDRYVAEADTNNLTIQMEFNLANLISGKSFFDIVDYYSFGFRYIFEWPEEHFNEINSIDFSIATNINNIGNVNNAVLFIKNYNHGGWDDMSGNLDIKQEDENVISYKISDPDLKFDIIRDCIDHANNNSMEFQFRYNGTGPFDVSINVFTVNIGERNHVSNIVLRHDPLIQELVYPNHIEESALNGTITGGSNLDSLKLNDDNCFEAQADTNNLSIEFKFNLQSDIDPSYIDTNMFDWGTDLNLFLWHVISAPIYPNPPIPRIEIRLSTNVSIDTPLNLSLATIEMYKGENNISFLPQYDGLEWFPLDADDNKTLAIKDETKILGDEPLVSWMTWICCQLINASDDNSFRLRFVYIGNGSFERFNVSVDEFTLSFYIQNEISSDITSKIGLCGPKIQPILEFAEPPISQYKTGTHYMTVRISKASKQPLENFEVIFEVLNSYGVPVSYSTAISNDEGIASASLQFEQIGNGYSIRVRFAEEGIYASTATLSGYIRVVDDFILMMDLFLKFLPYIIIAIIALISFAAIRYQRKVKLRNLWSQKALVLDDLIKISHIMVIHKDIGVLLYEKQITSEIINGDLISGFLHAISQFRGEFNGDRTSSTESKGFEMDYYDFKIIIADGNYIRAAFILDGTPSQTTKDKQREFVTYFEKKYDKYLRNFDGTITTFKKTDAILEHYFNILLINPLQLGQEWKSVRLKGLERDLVEVAEQIQKEKKVFFVSSLLNLGLAGRKASRDEIISAIIELKNKKIIVPVKLD